MKLHAIYREQSVMSEDEQRLAIGAAEEELQRAPGNRDLLGGGTRETGGAHFRKPQR